MKRLNPNRKHNRDQIRYRLHTTIEAAAYLADDSSEQDVDRELSKIMNGAKPKTSVSSSKLERCPATADTTLTVARAATRATLALSSAAIGAFSALSILFSFSPHSAGLVLGGLAGAVASVSLKRVLLRIVKLLINRDARYEQATRIMGIRMADNVRIHITKPGETDPITGSQQEQASLSTWQAT
jgi:hypothetical protein